MSRRVGVLTAAAALAVAACGQGGEGATAPAGPGIRGVLRDEAGAVLADAEVLACQATICQFGVTDEAGAFAFSVDVPAEVAIKTRENLSAVPPRGSALYPVRLARPSNVDLDDVHIPTLPPATTIGGPEHDPQTLAAGDGVVLTLRRGDLIAGGHSVAGVAARSIPAARTPDLPALDGEEIVAVFALHPFGVKSRTPIAVQVETKLPAGTPVQMRTISELDGTLSVPVAGTSDGSVLTTQPGSGILEITWLVITR